MEHSISIQSMEKLQSYCVILTYLPLSYCGKVRILHIDEALVDRTFLFPTSYALSKDLWQVAHGLGWEKMMEFNMHWFPMAVHKVYVHDSSIYEKEVW